MNICENIIGPQLFPDHDAIVAGEQRLTYADIQRLSARAAYVLQSLGVERQDRVGIVLPNVPAFVIWYYACLRVGAIVVSVSTRLSGEEVAFVLSDCNAKVVVGPVGLVEMLSGMLPDCVDQVVQVSEDAQMVVDLVGDQRLADGESIGDTHFVDMEPDDPATILYTSGTTGFPKGATLSHKNVRATMCAFNHLCGMQPEDRMLLAVPLFHCYGQNALLNSALNVGATLILQKRFDLAESKQLIKDHQITMLFGVPTTFQLMLESCRPSDVSSIRYCFSAAAKLPEQLSAAWREKFEQPIYEGYGLTETAPFASYNHRLKFVPGSIGTPVDLVEMKVVDTDTGETCPAGTPGEIAIRGPNVMLGYWNRPAETAEVLKEGWFHSGDIGQTDEQGFFYIVDRLKDMIVVGGMKVFPAEVERVLLDHAAVSEAAIVGFPDEVLGEKVVAFIVASEDATASAEEIRSHCGAHLGSYKLPRRVVFVDSLPRNPAGKVLKTQLREYTLPTLQTESSVADLTAAPPSPTLPEIGPLLEQLRATHLASQERFLTQFIQDQLRSLTGHDDVPAADGLLSEAEMDSLMIVEFRDRLQMQLGSRFDLPATLVFDHPRVSDLVSFLLSSFVDDGQDAKPQPIEVGTASVDTRSSSDTSIDDMSEQQAMEALLRELND